MPKQDETPKAVIEYLAAAQLWESKDTPHAKELTAQAWQAISELAHSRAATYRKLEQEQREGQHEQVV